MKGISSRVRTLAVALAMGLSLVAGAANAVTSTLTFTDNSSSFDSVFGNSAITGLFSDIYNFTIPTDAGGDGGASVISGFGITGFNVSFFNFSLVDTTTSTLLASGSTGPFSFIGFSGLDLGHSFALGVSGTGKGSYAGNLSLSPIPEAETYAMMLAGLGMMGFMARRRKTDALS